MKAYGNRAVLLIVLLSFCVGACSLKSTNDKQKEQTTTFPEIHISIDAKDIDRDEWRDVQVTFDGEISDYNFQSESAQIKGRGNSTWKNMGEKRPFRIRFDEERSMMGSAYEAKDWVFIANAMDYSLMRNYLAYSLGSELMEYAPASEFVHVYLNDDYRGVYLLSDEIEAHKGRAELEANEDPTQSEYLIEWDMRARPEQNNDYHFAVDSEIYFVIEYPDEDNLSKEHIVFVQEVFQDVDTLFERGDYESIKEVIDVDSFIDYYLIQELFRNADVGASSLYFQIQQVNGKPKVFAGPLWDFDFSSGVGLPPGVEESEYMPEGAWAARVNKWFFHLFETEWFPKLVKERWIEIRDDEVRAMIEDLWDVSKTYKDDLAKNFERWDTVIGTNLWRVSPAVVEIKDYEGNIEYLADWLEKRIVWLNSFLENR